MFNQHLAYLINQVVSFPQGHGRRAQGSAHQGNAGLAQDPGVQDAGLGQQAKAS